MPSDADQKPPSDEAALARAAPYPTSRLAPRFELVDLAREIQQADQIIGSVTSGKLDIIREQMLALQEQARRVLEEARTSARLHRARCNFKKTPGGTYHLYRRDDGELYFSMLSPDDWRGSPPHAYEGSYRLEADLSWTPLEAARERPDPQAVVRAILAAAPPVEPSGED